MASWSVTEVHGRQANGCWVVGRASRGEQREQSCYRERCSQKLHARSEAETGKTKKKSAGFVVSRHWPSCKVSDLALSVAAALMREKCTTRLGRQVNVQMESDWQDSNGRRITKNVKENSRYHLPLFITNANSKGRQCFLLGNII